MSCASMFDSRSDGRGGRRTALLLVGAAIVAAGCLATVRLAREATGFDHAAHAKRDLSCLDCHADAKTKPLASLPTVAQCTECHDPKTEKPATVKVVTDFGTALAAKRFPSTDVRGPSYGDVKFDHAKHAAANVDCTKCHAGADKGATPQPDGPLGMSQCMSCHKERGASNDCATCHEKRRQDERPPNHTPIWPLHHGPVSRAPDAKLAAEKCNLCHTESSCTQCHERNAPRDHNQTWRVATHGLSASMDRSRCLACHQADSCARCHSTQPPRSHRSGFGSPRDSHCLSCHLPVKTESCAACHQGTPSHQLAPAKPADHNAASNCRQCHQQGSATMPHVDNLSNCNSCHN